MDELNMIAASMGDKQYTVKKLSETTYMVSYSRVTCYYIFNKGILVDIQVD